MDEALNTFWRDTLKDNGNLAEMHRWEMVNIISRVRSRDRTLEGSLHRSFPSWLYYRTERLIVSLGICIRNTSLTRIPAWSLADSPAHSIRTSCHGAIIFRYELFQSVLIIKDHYREWPSYIQNPLYLQYFFFCSMKPCSIVSILRHTVLHVDTN